ncbi:MAG: hypothetical protein FWH02_05530, partial [Oscillospiraceae bacterium]|nr:hypothetical protein [Oscillospiraceae bacterium]
MLKKALSALLALTLILTLGVSALASTGTGKAPSVARVNGVREAIDFTESPDTDMMTPGSVIRYPLTADMFSWSDGATYGPLGVTRANLTNVTLDFRGVNSRIMKTPVLVDASHNGLSTVYVQIEFADENASLNSVNFNVTLFLRYRQSREEASEIAITGSFGPNEREVYSGSRFASMGPDVVIIARDNLTNFELELSRDVSMYTTLQSGRRYYGYASEGVTSADRAVETQFRRQLLGIIRIQTIGLPTSGKLIELRGYSGAHVYNAAGQYLGTTNDRLDVSSIYYIMSERVDMSGVISGAPVTPPVEPSTPGNISAGNNNVVITGNDLVNQTSAAVTTARNRGSTNAIVTVRNGRSITRGALDRMQATAANSRMNAQLNSDTMSGNTVAGRISMLAGRATLNSDIQLGVHIDENSVKATRDFFGRWYRNKLQVVSLSQKGSYGMVTRISAKVNLSGMNARNLEFYTYDSKSNTLRRIAAPQYLVDSNGYLQF